MAATFGWKLSIAHILAVLQIHVILTILAFFQRVSACKESIEVAGSTCWRAQIKMATSKEVVLDRHSLEVSLDVGNLGLFLRFFYAFRDLKRDEQAFLR